MRSHHGGQTVRHRLVHRLGRALHQAGQYEQVGILKERSHIGLKAGKPNTGWSRTQPFGGFGENPAADHQFRLLGRQCQQTPRLEQERHALALIDITREQHTQRSRTRRAQRARRHGVGPEGNHHCPNSIGLGQAVTYELGGTDQNIGKRDAAVGSLVLQRTDRDRVDAPGGNQRLITARVRHVQIHQHPRAPRLPIGGGARQMVPEMDDTGSLGQAAAAPDADQIEQRLLNLAGRQTGKEFDA